MPPPANYSLVFADEFARLSIANTDAGGDAWVHYAIDQAERAVRELTS